MKLSNQSAVPVYTISGSSTARPLPEWLIRKRRRSLKQDPEFANRIELLQDFEFEEASSCVRVSEDGEWVVSTGTYKPQMHVHYLPHLSLSYTRHTNTLNSTFQLLSTDYSKSLHLQTDRFLEFHTPSGCHYTTRIPRYGRDLKYDRRTTEALVPVVGVNAEGAGEVYRLNLEVGRFMKGYEVEVGGDDLATPGGGALQGGINTGSVNCAAIAEQSHGLLAFGTSLGSVEFWDSRSRSRVGVLAPPPPTDTFSPRAEISCVEFDPSGLTIATGSSEGIIKLFDLRSPSPYLTKDQGYGYPIHTLTFLHSNSLTSQNAHLAAEPKILSSDKRIIKIWNQADGSPWTSVEPAVDLNCVAWCKDSGMFLTANEGRQQHSFFIPQLGPAPKWCSFLDNLVEEMAEDSADPNSFAGGSAAHKAGEVYDNYKFLSVPQLRSLNLDHLIGQTGLLRPYMHGYFVAQQLYEEARLISNPDLWQEQRQKSIREKINKERESRIRGSKKVAVKVNRKLAERMLEREDKNERRKARRALKKAADVTGADVDIDEEELENERIMQTNTAEDDDDDEAKKPERPSALNDPRFAAMFQDEDFEVDENSAEFALLNPSSKLPSTSASAHDGKPRGLTAVEQEALSDAGRGSDSDMSQDDDSDASDSDAPRAKKSDDRANGRPNKFSTASYRKSANQQRRQQHNNQGPKMSVSSSSQQGKANGAGKFSRDRSFGARAADLGSSHGRDRARKSGGVVGEREVSWTTNTGKKKPSAGRNDRSGGSGGDAPAAGRGKSYKDRRSASMNTFRSKMR